LIRKHKGFFNKIDKRLLEDYLRAGQDILMVLEDREKTELQQDMASIQERWKVLLTFYHFTFSLPYDLIIYKLSPLILWSSLSYKGFSRKKYLGGRNSINNLGYYHQNFNYFWGTTT
jgi:hypothetical protein